MRYEVIGQLVDRWMGDAVFRAALRKDLAAAVRGAGLRLQDDELAALRGIDWGQSDDTLRERMMKFFV